MDKCFISLYKYLRVDLLSHRVRYMFNFFKKVAKQVSKVVYMSSSCQILILNVAKF